MNRPIKFRVWDERQPRPYMNYAFAITQDGHLLEYRRDEWDGETYTEPTGRDKLHVMQFTGMRDATGAEVYEGDILKALNAIKEEPERGPLRVEVYFRNGVFHPYGHDDVIGGKPVFDPSEWTVIANRYENPEILEPNFGSFDLGRKS